MVYGARRCSGQLWEVWGQVKGRWDTKPKLDLEAWQRPDSRPVRSSRFSSYILRSSAGAFPEISPDQTRNETCSNSNGEIGGTVAPHEPIELKLCTSDYVAHQRPHMHHGVTVGSWTSALDKGET